MVSHSCAFQLSPYVLEHSPLSRTALKSARGINGFRPSFIPHPVNFEKAKFSRITKDSFFLPCLARKTEALSTTENDQNGAWLPIGSAKGLVGNVPTSIEVAGEKLVVWKNGAEWSVLRDACPHRLAPLSQGRVDPSTGCIECPYHGWQFSTGGSCTKIPQLALNKLQSQTGMLDDREITSRTDATSYPVHLTGDMIWAYLPLPAGQVDPCNCSGKAKTATVSASEACSGPAYRSVPLSFYRFLASSLVISLTHAFIPSLPPCLHSI